MHSKRPVVVAILVLSFILIASGALNAPIGYAQAGPSAGRAQEQADNDQSHPKPSPDKLRLAGLSNGGFEAGPGAGWTEYSDLGRSIIVDTANLPAGVTPHGGNWAAWLGGADGETASISQTVTVPTTHPILSFWEWIGSLDACNYNYDFGTISINDTWVTSFPLCSSENTYGWIKRTLNMGAYAGQTVDLQFRVKTDSGARSDLFIDDVAVEGQSFAHSVYLPIALGSPCSAYDYFDGFGAPSGAWYPGVFEADYGVTAHQYTFDGEYQLRFEGPGPDMWWYAHDLAQAIPSSNYRVEADMRSAADYTTGTYGLRFGVHWYEASPGDWQMDQLYQIVIDPYYQEYFVEKLVGGNWSTLRNWTYTGAINADQATNHLRVDRVGTSIRIYINGTAMPALTDASITAPGRDAGVVAYGHDNYPVDMRFDNFHASTCLQ